MLMNYLILIITWSIIFLFLKHPLSIGGILLIQTIMISLITGMMSFNYWFSYILFLIMIGGMLILFIYMTSVASNEKFKFSFNLLITLIFPILFISMSWFLDNFFSNILLFNSEMINFSTLTFYQLSMSKYFNFPLNLIMIMMILYLLITLIAVVKITKLNSGPLRQKF